MPWSPAGHFQPRFRPAFLPAGDQGTCRGPPERAEGRAGQGEQRSGCWGRWAGREKPGPVWPVGNDVGRGPNSACRAGGPDRPAATRSRTRSRDRRAPRDRSDRGRSLPRYLGSACSASAGGPRFSIPRKTGRREVRQRWGLACWGFAQRGLRRPSEQPDHRSAEDARGPQTRSRRDRGGAT